VRATAFVLAAGLGTRLRPLTERVPKALVPVGGVPMLDHAIAQLRRHGHRQILVNAHHHAPALEAAGRRLGVEVTVEPTILGTGGGLRAARDRLAERFVVVNADVIADVDLTALLDRVPAGGAAMALRPHRDAARYGLAAADSTGTVVRLRTLPGPTSVGPVADDTHFTGLHALDRASLDAIPEGEADVIDTVYRKLLPEGRVRALRHPGTWIDVGEPGVWLGANLALLTTRLPVPLDVGPLAAYARLATGTHGTRPPGVEVEGACWIGPRVRFGHQVRLKDCVVGADARVSDDVVLDRCVVFDGVQVPRGAWREVAFHPGGVLALASLEAR
jgi:NDP-sugar pyrophosphorylase family protein